MAATAPHTTETPRPLRTPVSAVRQLFRLTRTELTLFHRYRTALYMAFMPLVLLLPAFSMPEAEVGPGILNTAYLVSGVPVLSAMTLAVLHMPNVYAARRETMVLKRFRVSGVPPVALFGATAVAVFLVTVVLTALIAALMAARFDTLPSDPLLLLLAVALTTAIVSMLGLVFTNLARNSESAQMISMVPFLLFFAISGTFVPTDLMPAPVATGVSYLPMLPAIDIARSAYFGVDTFGGLDGASATTGLDLWAAAAPSLLVLLVWLGISIYLLRFFRWDPRQAG
ncbi:ABC transporter permease [Nocardiopsis gilva YIM 90087]|uniref:Transport permease protein n=1 Tax=Nocardiopsis gilva YIM 90087 TaxID=1235441 RepID=A0A223S2H3_9ACTN|nr:ABC transporter permease [Nocardiopsis gilva]ASU82326.1 ABC transporter permease [Nocardiopsis gilva YIM 90087]